MDCTLRSYRIKKNGSTSESLLVRSAILLLIYFSILFSDNYVVTLPTPPAPFGEPEAGWKVCGVCAQGRVTAVGCPPVSTHP